MRSGRRWLELDGVRGLAATSIVVLHVWMFDRGDAGHPPKRPLDVVLGELRLGVVLFFVLSGFLVYRPWVRAALEGRPAPSIARFALRRIARVGPAYWVAVVGSAALLWSIRHPLLPDARTLALFAVFLENYFPASAGRLDPPMWTLAVEASFYLALPLFGWLALRVAAATATGRGAQAALCAAPVALGIACGWLAHAHGWPETATASLLVMAPYFAAGMAACVLTYGRALGRGAGWALVCGGVACVVADCVWHVRGTGALRFALRDVPAAVGCASILAALTASPVRSGLLRARPLRALGTVSYGLYLWHFPVIVALRAHGHWPDRLGVALALTLAISVALAAASWLLVERPALRWAARERPRRPAGYTPPSPAGVAQSVRAAES